MTRGYLLDTNTVIDMLKARRGVQRQVVEHGPQNCFISDITISELMTGYYLSGNPTEKKDIDFVRENFTLLRVTPSVLDKFAKYRAALHKKGCPVPALDLMILATASVNELVPVSHDIHFNIFPELKAEDWTER